MQVEFQNQGKLQPVGELPEGPPLLQLDISVSHDCFCKADAF